LVPSTTAFYTLSLHDALPIYAGDLRLVHELQGPPVVRGPVGGRTRGLRLVLSVHRPAGVPGAYRVLCARIGRPGPGPGRQRLAPLRLAKHRGAPTQKGPVVTSPPAVHRPVRDVTIGLFGRR